MKFCSSIHLRLMLRGTMLVGLVQLLLGDVVLGSTDVSLYSGTFEGDHPPPAFVGVVYRGERFQVQVGRVSAIVNYPDPFSPVELERVVTHETGGIVTCPWYVRMDAKPQTRVDERHVSKIDHKVFCDHGGCSDWAGNPIPASQLLFGRYNLPKCVRGNDNADFGFLDRKRVQNPVETCAPGGICVQKTERICCQEFSVERTFAEVHYFDRLLIVDSFREQPLTDLDVDFRKLYLTFENSEGERATCGLTDLLSGGDLIKINDLKDCVLPEGDLFTMYAQSRFFHKETRPCGKFIAKGLKTPEGYVPDWFLGWYECDGEVDRTPIVKQYSYATRLELKFVSSNLGGNQ